MGKYADGKVNIEQAARELRMSPECLRQSMIHDSLPIRLGVVTKAEKNNAYHIYKEPLRQLKKLWGIE